MDRNTVTGLVLIFLVMVVWAYVSLPGQEELQQQKEQARQDSIAAVQADSEALQQKKVAATGADTDTSTAPQASLKEGKDESSPHNMGMFTTASQKDTTNLFIETPLYRTKFTNLGAGPATFTLKNYETWDAKPIQMIGDTTRSAYSLGFLTSENYNVDSDELLFEQVTPQHTLQIEEGDSAQVQYALNIAPDKRILYTYTLRGDSYEIDLDISFEGLRRTIIGSSVDFGWKPPLNLTEKNRTQAAGQTSSYAYTGGEQVQFSLSESGREEKSYNGSVRWVASRTKFFTQVIKSDTPTEGALLIGEITDAADQAEATHKYETYLKGTIPDNGVASFKMYAGPLAYHALENFDESTYGMVNVGYSWTRWFSDPLVRYIIIPYFDHMSDYMNVGLAIILFGILVKLLLYPLTKKSFKSMAAMKELQPKMNELKEKYKDDPQKQQAATMKLYKKEKVNPIGGCLPNLLQLPILVTLYRFFQHSILIRQESFLWAHDLSTPDYIINLPFDVPIIGSHIAGFVLLMSAAMMVQSHITGGMGGPGGGGAGGMNMSALKYIFPVMLLFIFNNFAAGLSLYYLVYNVVSICQQLLINRQIEKEKEMKEVVA